MKLTYSKKRRGARMLRLLAYCFCFLGDFLQTGSFLEDSGRGGVFLVRIFVALASHAAGRFHGRGMRSALETEKWEGQQKWLLPTEGSAWCMRR